MKLYGDHRSGNCDKVVFAVAYLGLDYEWIEVDSADGATRTTEFLAINPRGQVPTAIFPDGKVLGQSNAIVRYLSAGSDLLPDDPWARAKIDEWMFWEANNHEFFVAGCISHMTYMDQSFETRDTMRVRRGDEALDMMERHLKTADWLVGDRLTVADISLLAYTRQAHRGGFDMNRRTKVREWISRCEDSLGLPSA